MEFYIKHDIRLIGLENLCLHKGKKTKNAAKKSI